MKNEKCRQNRLSEKIVRHCSPTLAGLKSAGMFSITCEDYEDILCEIRNLNKRLGKKGVKIIPLRYTNGRCLLYVFRLSELTCDFEDKCACKLLKESGYKSCKPVECIGKLIKRLNSEEEFPHEIGLFLGYPPEDVCGYIRNKGKCQKCTGHWKVYGDEKSALNKFKSFKQCTHIFCKMISLGIPIEKLAIAG
ncbi:MAG TPA: DUF3793 family protein [Mogibacterium sp.]|nr:DUF3793 family protein [Mogibacterium sp.]